MLLAVDTSTAQLGLALYEESQVKAEWVWTSQAHHTIELAPALSVLLERVGITVQHLSALAIAIGPGSFTSLRVGLAFVKGLALARSLPVIGIPTLDVVAASVPVQDLRLAAVIQAGRGRIAVGWYHADREGWQAEGPAQVTTVEGLAESIRQPTLIVGELTAAERQRLARRRKWIRLASVAQSVRRPAVLAELAWKKYQAGQTADVPSLAPMYLHMEGGPS